MYPLCLPAVLWHWAFIYWGFFWVPLGQLKCSFCSVWKRLGLILSFRLRKRKFKWDIENPSWFFFLSFNTSKLFVTQWVIPVPVHLPHWTGCWVILLRDSWLVFSMLSHFLCLEANLQRMESTAALVIELCSSWKFKDIFVTRIWGFFSLFK